MKAQAQFTISNINDGANGKDAYTIILSNESHTFVGSTSSAIASSATCDITVLKGIVSQAISISTITGQVAGLTTSVSYNSEKTKATITINVTTSMTTKCGVLQVPIIADGKTFEKTISYSVAFTGSKGVSVTSTDVMYYLSTSSSNLTDGEWGTSVVWENGKYIWSKIITTYSDSSTTESQPVCISGEKGSNGAIGTGVISIRELYIVTNSKTTVPTSPTSPDVLNGWSSISPTWTSGNYIWTLSEIIYSNPTNYEYTVPICDSSWEAINDIRIGGRNLVRNSSTLLYESYGFVQYVLTSNGVFLTDNGKKLKM